MSKKKRKISEFRQVINSVKKLSKEMEFNRTPKTQEVRINCKTYYILN